MALSPTFSILNRAPALSSRSRVWSVCSGLLCQQVSQAVPHHNGDRVCDWMLVSLHGGQWSDADNTKGERLGFRVEHLLILL